jgi:hypothetical protein
MEKTSIDTNLILMICALITALAMIMMIVTAYQCGSAEEIILQRKFEIIGKEGGK